jgi:EAL and modified HD-GYP domain-containing signal transduction protein
MESVYLARQPILNKDEDICCYEILYRDAQRKSNVNSNIAVSVSVITSILNKFGTKSLLGNKKVFVKVDERFLLNDIVFTIPKEFFIFSLFADIELSEKVVYRLDELYKLGYELAINDSALNHEFIQKYRVVFHQLSFVKINFDVLASYEIAELITELHRHKVGVVAAKIENLETYELAKNVNCDYFEGYFFAEPVILENAKCEPFQLNELKLYNLLMQDVNIDEITSEFEKTPEITMQLLQFMNSAAFHFRKKISSLHHVLILLGRIPLGRWLVLLIYSKSVSKTDKHSPLMLMVINRTYLMEKILKTVEPGAQSNMLGEAYMVGVLSLMDTLFGMRMSEVLEGINVADSVKDAILSDKGIFGEIYGVVRATESFNIDEVMAFERKYKLEKGAIKNLVIEGIEYVNEFENPGENDS